MDKQTQRQAVRAKDCVGQRIGKLRHALGFKTQQSLAIAANVSRASVLRMEHGGKISPRTAIAVAATLGIDPVEIDPRSILEWKTDSELLDSVASNDSLFSLIKPLQSIETQYNSLVMYWVKPEPEIKKVFGNIDAMQANLRILEPKLDRLDDAQRINIGKMAGQLAGFLWSCRGDEKSRDLNWLCNLASRCAISVDYSDPANAAIIHAHRYANAPGWAAWNQPDRMLPPDETEKAVRNFALSHLYFSQAEMVDNNLYGAHGFITIEHLLYLAQIHIQGGRKQWPVARNLLDDAAQRAGNDQPALQAHILVLNSLLASKQNTRKDTDRARDSLFEAIQFYQSYLNITDHHLIASCRMRLRQLGVSENRTLQNDIDFLTHSSIRYTDVVNLSRVWSDYYEDFAKRTRRNP